MNFSSLFVQISTIAPVCLVRFGEGNGENIDVYMSNLKKVRMDNSCHGRYKGIQIDFCLFSLLTS